MSKNDFNNLAEETLERLASAIEKADIDYVLDVDVDDGVLNIALPEGEKYVINKHEVSEQIWFSSPFSGAAKFSYDEDNEVWLDANDNELLDLLSQELEEAVGLEIAV